MTTGTHPVSTEANVAGYKGEIMSLGERAPLALCDASAAARMTIGEALTNMLGGYVLPRANQLVACYHACYTSIANGNEKVFTGNAW
jgi:phosphoribosylformylglycinamidine (FGAM) synthase-like enzyme